jgi:hypothetical protein
MRHEVMNNERATYDCAVKGRATYIAVKGRVRREWKGRATHLAVKGPVHRA